MEKTKKIKLFAIAFFAAVFFAFTPAFCFAADIIISPSSGSFDVGATFTVNVMVASADQAMNAASGKILFPADKLEVVSLSKSGSIFNFWVQEPAFLNSSGTITFEGIVLNPGYTGKSAKAIGVTFKAKAAGRATLAFANGSVLANDGKGTNILGALATAAYSLNEKTEAPKPPTTDPAPTVPSSGLPTAPKVVSGTHADSSRWYANNSPRFEWAMPANATGVSILADNKPTSNPGTQPDGLFSSYVYDKFDDGVWYFHVRIKNAAGWGPITHFGFNIDTTKPESFSIERPENADLTDPKVEFKLVTNDKTSGIDRYEIQIDGGAPQTWNGEGNYVTPTMSPGAHTLVARAIDKAGNIVSATTNFEVKTINAPTITDYPKTISSGDLLVVRGTTSPETQVILWLKRDNDEAKSYVVLSDKDGRFLYVSEDKINDGDYVLWAEAMDNRGGKSAASEKYTISTSGSSVLRLGTKAVNALAVIIMLVALIALLAAVCWFAFHRFMTFRRRVLKETRDAENVLHKAIDTLKDDIESQIRLLERAKNRRELTTEEDKIIKKLKKDLNEAEKAVGKEIDDIRKDAE
jgi:hypothetical protein